MTKISTPLILATALGFIAGLLWLMGVHFVTYKSAAVHYHGNFALYINGQRDEFKSFTFYEETSTCGLGDKPANRVHLHDHNASLVHVHDAGATWGNLFENLGYTLGDKLVSTDAGVYVDGADGKKLQFLLNGQPVEVIANRVINSEDVLLINYGDDSDAVLQKRYAAIPRDAAKANVSKDPASCGGSKPLTFPQRLREASGL